MRSTVARSMSPMLAKLRIIQQAEQRLRELNSMRSVSASATAVSPPHSRPAAAGRTISPAGFALKRAFRKRNYPPLRPRIRIYRTFASMDFKLVSEYKPTGDQPEAIAQLVDSIRRGSKHNTLLGVTGSGKTFTAANVIAQINKPTLVLSHNKTLAAPLYGEFQISFRKRGRIFRLLLRLLPAGGPTCQPRIPSSKKTCRSTTRSKDASANLRDAPFGPPGRDRRLVRFVPLRRRQPEDFHATAVSFKVGDIVNFKQFLYKLVEALYTRTERDLLPRDVPRQRRRWTSWPPSANSA